MKRTFTAYHLSALICLLVQASGTQAQQLPQFSQYMLNPYVLNPAASSLHSDIDVNMGFRQQWSGFDGAPQTYYVSGTVNLGKKPESKGYLHSIPISNRRLLTNTAVERHAKHVVGGLAAVDEYGLFKRSSVMASYAYHHPVGKEYYIAVGTSLGWYGLNFGADQVILENALDNTYNDFIANGTRANLFDINAGAMLYGERLFVGYSVYQIGQNEIELGNQTTPAGLAETRLALHQFATAGYRFTLSDQIDLTPSLMLKLRGPAPASFDINARADFNERFFLGFSYRYQDAVSAIAGFYVSDWMRIGYAYDYITSRINNLSSGSHEIVLGLRFDRK